jgi:hypothetical protein
MQRVLQFVLYAPEIQVPVALACGSLVLADAVWRGLLSNLLRTAMAGALLWLLLIFWFMRSEPTWNFRGAEIVGLSLGLVVGFFAYASMGVRRKVVATRTRIEVGMFVALVASFAAPIVFLCAGCGFGDCP